MGYYAWRHQILDTLKNLLNGMKRLEKIEERVVTFPLYNNNAGVKVMYAYLEE